MFSHLSPEKPHKCVLKPSEQGSFFQDNHFEGSHALVYSKNEHFPIYLIRITINVCWNPQNRAHFSKTIDLRGHMPMFILKMYMFSHLSPEKPHKCVLKPSEQCAFLQEDRLWGVTCLGLPWKMYVFPSISMRNPINVCWNPQNRAHFSETIDLRGHMHRFTLKMNIFPSISLESP